MTAAAAWLVRALFVRSKRPVSGGRWITGFSMGRSTAAGTSGAGAGSTGLATIGATGSGFGTSALASSRIGRGGAGRAGRRGATTGADGNFTSSVAGMMNTIVDRLRGAGGFSDARIGMTIRTTTTMACNTTLSHRPVVQRPCGRVLNRASSNRIDMCRTELKCRSVRLQRRCCLGSPRASEVPPPSLPANEVADIVAWPTAAGGVGQKAWACSASSSGCAPRRSWPSSGNTLHA